ncbi:hypothetical protein V6N11_029640 [Hibiscus sabdariffa]|uniref:Uncharacterized protein n=1 Tax=Hibiscus sabdariffa TaxID=183260 RepID=A0ABR2P7A8_9ROSI
MHRHITTPIQSFLMVLENKLGATTISRIKAPGSSSQSALDSVRFDFLHINFEIFLAMFKLWDLHILPGKRLGKNRRRTTATKAIHFPICPLFTI